MKALTAGWLMLRGFSHVVGGWWTIRTRFPHMTGEASCSQRAISPAISSTASALATSPAL